MDLVQGQEQADFQFRHPAAFPIRQGLAEGLEAYQGLAEGLEAYQGLVLAEATKNADSFVLHFAMW